MSEDALWEACGFILASPHRRRILHMLVKAPSQPTELALALGIPPSNVSSLLRPLVRRGIAKCMNPAARKGRIYGATGLGDQVAEKLAQLGK